jgi:hypothetical protein
MSPSGYTALFDAIAAGVDASDNAAASDDARRAVVVLSDGEATYGDWNVEHLLEMASDKEARIDHFECNLDGGCSTAFDNQGRPVPVKKVLGSKYAKPTKHPVQVFFIGVGEANLQIGRIMAEATGAEYRGTTADDLATVISEFGDYF